MQEVACQHCGNTIRTKRPDRRKWCDRCRALKNIINLRAKVHTCVGCGEAYYAHDSTSARARTRLCPNCTGSPAGETRDTDHCAFCDSDERLLPGVALCYLCATRATDHDVANRVTRSVLRKLKEVAK